VNAFNEMNNAANRKYQSRIKEEATARLAATEESGNGGGFSQMPYAIHRQKVRENRDAKLGVGTVQKERHEEYANQKSRTLLFSKNQSPDTADKWEEGALGVINDHRQDVQDVGAKESDVLALGSDVVALQKMIINSKGADFDVSTMQSTVKVNVDLVQEYKGDRNKKESLTEELVKKYMDSKQIVTRNSRSGVDSQDATTERSDRIANSSVRKTVAAKAISRIIPNNRSAALSTIQETNNNKPDLVRQSPKIIDLTDTDTGSDEDSSNMDQNAVLSKQGNNPDLGRQSRNRSAGPSRLLTPRNPSSPVSFTPMASSSSSQPMSPVVRKVKDQESSNRTSVSPLQQDSASQMALKIYPLMSKGGVFSLENTSSSILTRIRLHDVNHFTFDNDLPLIGINGEEEMEFDIFGDHPICSPIVRMPLKKRLLTRKEHEDVLAGGGYLNATSTHNY